MFLNLLSESQKESFLALATKVVMADGEVAPKEHVTLNVRLAEMGGKIKAPPAEIFGEPNYEIFDTMRAQTIVILELLVIAYSDQNYHEDERPIIDQLATEFGFSKNEMKLFEDWAARQAPLSIEGWSFIAATGGSMMKD